MMARQTVKMAILGAVSVLTASCGAYYSDQVRPPSEQDLEDARQLHPKGALKEGVFHMQKVDEGSAVRVKDNIVLKYPDLPPFDVAYISRNVEQVLLELANAAGESIVIPQGLRNRTVTVVHSGGNFRQMLDIVLGKIGYHYNYVDGVWVVTRYPIRSYVLEVGQSKRRGSLISETELKAEEGENATSGNSGSEPLDTAYQDELWDQVESTLEELVKVGKLEDVSRAIASSGVNGDGRILPANSGRSLGESVQVENEDGTVDVLGMATERGGLSPTTLPSVPSTDHLQPEENAEPWFKITRSAGLITVRAAPEAHRMVEGYLERIHDTALKQVYVEVRIVAVTRDKTTDRGTNITGNVEIGDSVLSNIGFTANTPLTATDAAGAFINTFMTDGGGDQDLSVIMKALSNIGSVYTVSSPSLLARNNQLSRVSLTRQLGYAETQVDQNTTTTGDIVIGSRTDQVRFKNSGTVLSVFPYIGKSKVQMRVRLSVASQSGETEIRTSVGEEDPIVNLVPELSTNVVDQDVVLEYGRVYAIGGLIETSTNAERDYIPGLSDLPGMGEVFQRAKNSKQDTEFIVFLRVSRS